MRLLFVMDRAWPAVGGAEMLARNVARALAENHDVTVIALRTDDGPKTRLSNGLRLPPPFQPFADGPVRYEPLRLSVRQRAALLPTCVQVVPVVARYAFGRARRAIASAYSAIVGPAIAASQASGVDIVHTWSADLVGVAGVRAARSLDARSLVTPFLHVGQWGADPASVGAYRAADRVVALLGTEKEALVELGVPVEKVVICGACTPGMKPGGGAEIRSRHSVAGPVVLFVGARRPYKGFDVLLDAAPIVAMNVPDVTFVFVGPGEPVAQPPGVRVVDAGKAPTEELAAWLDAADLLCLPSEHEIFPTSILEAWSVGTPALVSDIPTLRELIRSSGGGWTVPRDARSLANAIRDLLSNPATLQERGRRGKAFWRGGHTPDAVAKRYERIYAELLGDEKAAQG